MGLYVQQLWGCVEKVNTVPFYPKVFWAIELDFPTHNENINYTNYNFFDTIKTYNLEKKNGQMIHMYQFNQNFPTY